MTKGIRKWRKQMKAGKFSVGIHTRHFNPVKEVVDSRGVAYYELPSGELRIKPASQMQQTNDDRD